MLNELIDSEREDLEDLKVLRRRVTDAESLRLINGLLERKVERVIELNQLLRYRDREKEAELAQLYQRHSTDEWHGNQNGNGNGEE